MRRKHLQMSAVALLLALLLVGAPFGKCAERVEESDFEDDGQVEDVQEDTAAEEKVEELEEYESPSYDPQEHHFVDTFDDLPQSQKTWIKSQAKKDDIAEEIAKYDGIWNWEAPQRIVSKKDIGLVLKSKAKHAAIAARMHKPFTFQNQYPLVVQYEVTMQEGQECGGSYIKLLSDGKHVDDLTKFNDKTPYTIMFGPDKCGNDIKMHFIFRHVNPVNGSVEEKHAKKPKDRLDEPFKDKMPHLYQLVLSPDNTYEVKVDYNTVMKGSLLSDFTPPVNPPREIDDPEDKKPKDWDEREKIPDPTAQKPEDWDDDAPPQIPDPTAVKPEGWLEEEPEMIPDPSAHKPEDWETEIDGEWEAPLVDNPVCEKAVGCGKWKAPLISNENYKGKWRAPLIDNPNYQGKWAPRKIPNPHYFEDENPFRSMTPISAIGIELWSMSSDILFDNLMITDSVEKAKAFAQKSFDVKRKFIERESKTLWHRLMRRMNYKPGWWALYFVYLLIPAGCYVFYLYRRAKEENFLHKAITFFTTDKVGTIISWVCGFGIIFTLAYTYTKKGKASVVTESDAAANAKKTDAVQPDDDKATADNGDKSNTTKKSSPKTKKSDLDVKDDVAEDGDGVAVAAAAAAATAPVDSEVAPDADEAEVEANPAEETESTGAKPRKRPGRKD